MLQADSHYKEGILHGKQTSWYENGQQRGDGNHKDGNLHGTFTLWDEKGQLIFETTYEDGDCVSAECFD